MKLLSIAFVLLNFTTILGCNQKSSRKDFNSLSRDISQVNEAPKKDYMPDERNDQFITDSTRKPQLPNSPDQKKEPSDTKPVPSIDWDKKIIKTAALNFEVKDYKTYYSALRERVRSVGGYVAQEEQSQSPYKIENTLVIKVPVDQFDAALAQLSTGVDKVNEKKVSSQDVTSEFVDVKSRIEAKKQVRNRYMDLLKQAKNMEEILDVQSEINGVQEEIESATGRIEYLGHSSTFSTINLVVYQVLNAEAKDVEDIKPSVGTRIGSAIKTGWSWIVDLFVGLLSVWPLIILIFAAFIWIKRMKPKKEL